MIHLRNDYSEGALPEIMEALVKSNLERTIGYGQDEYTEKAISEIKKKIGSKECEIKFLVGGTQTNLVAISHILRPYECVIAGNTGHISTHETGAVEATGHKVVEIEVDSDGKIDVERIDRAYQGNSSFHMVKPRMVYISNPTELGTLYSKRELEEISRYCKEKGLYLYLDGARMASALGSEKNDVALEDYPKYCDVFYLGGTKCGTMFGEAIVFINTKLYENFEYSCKQKGAVLAKGRLLGIQFYELFKGERYVNVGKHSNAMAKILKDGMKKLGYSFKFDSYTNQQFPIVPNEILKKLYDICTFEIWEKYDENSTVIRFVTSWATREEEIQSLLGKLEEFDSNKLLTK